MGPFPLESILGQAGAYGVYVLIGIAFGAVLEMSGFGNSTKLAAQFYFRELTVLKVMFTAIVVAMVLVFGAASVGLLDYEAIWVNPTYLWPGILGGLVMGVGFIIGGFCPGTSLVAMATLKLDGLFFVLGALTGIFLFGDTVGFYETFWHSSYLGRLTLPDLFGLSPGIVVVLVVLMALGMFRVAEYLEQRFGGLDPKKAPRWRYAAGFALLLLGTGVALNGQPTVEEQWAQLIARQGDRLARREVQISPAELLDLTHNDRQNLVLLDVREEADYNLFHLKYARRLDPDAVEVAISALREEPAGTVFVLMSNTEHHASEAYKVLTVKKIPNVYLLDGGLNCWLSTFAGEQENIFPLPLNAWRLNGVERVQHSPSQPVSLGSGSHEGGSGVIAQMSPCERPNSSIENADRLGFRILTALGDRHPVAQPGQKAKELGLTYVPKIKIKVNTAKKGGCG